MGELKTNLLDGSVIKNLLVLSAPLVFSFLLQSMFNIVDTFFVAKLGPEAIAAVSMSFPVLFFTIALGNGISTGVNSLIARSIGAKNTEKVNVVAENGFIIAFVLSVTITVAGILTIQPLFTFMGATPEILAMIQQYIHITYLWIIVIFAGFVANGILQGEGDTKTPTKGLVLGTVLNIILDPILIFGFLFIPPMGVRGAAIATIISRGIGLAYIFFYLFSGKAFVKLKFRKFAFDRNISKSILLVGIPASLSQMLMSASYFFINKIIALFGPLALAAFGIAFRFDSFAFLPAIGFAVATISIVGQNFGAKNYKRVLDTTKIASLLTFISMTCLGLVLFVAPRFWLGLFTENQEIISIGTTYLRYILLFNGFIGISLIYSFAFQAIGKANPSFIITFLRVAFISLPLAYILAINIGIHGIWIGMIVSNVTAAIIAPLWFYRALKKLSEESKSIS